VETSAGIGAAGINSEAPLMLEGVREPLIGSTGKCDLKASSTSNDICQLGSLRREGS